MIYAKRIKKILISFDFLNVEQSAFCFAILVHPKDLLLKLCGYIWYIQYICFSWPELIINSYVLEAVGKEPGLHSFKTTHVHFLVWFQQHQDKDLCESVGFLALHYHLPNVEGMQQCEELPEVNQVLHFL